MDFLFFTDSFATLTRQKKKPQENVEQNDNYFMQNISKMHKFMQILDLECEVKNVLSSSFLSKALIQIFPYHFSISLLLVIFQYASKIIMMVFFKYLIEASQISSLKYVYAAIVALCVIVFFVTKQSHEKLGPFIANNIKALQVSIIFKKISSFSQTTINAKDLGKTANLISSDYNAIESYFYNIFILPIYPFLFITLIIIISTWFGVIQSLICLGIPFILMNILYILGDKSGVYFEESRQKNDERIELTNIFLNSIKLIKMYTWEKYFCRQIFKKRKEEEDNLIKFNSIESVSFAVGLSSCIIGSLIAFYLKSLKGQLTASLIFATTQMIGFFITLNIKAAYGVFCFIQFNILLKRFGEFYIQKQISMQEIPSQQYQQIDQNQTNIRPIVEFKNFYGYWDIDSQPALDNICLKINRGNFYGIYGDIGSGKSSLLRSILGQILNYKGILRVDERINYCEQNIFLFNKSIRQNIVCYRQFSEERYQMILECCCLKNDLDKMPNGDNTNVGTYGNLLSGGQKARVGLARALYGDAELYLLDDPFSAIDSKVGQKIFENLRKKVLKQKTVILVTHQQFIHQCDKVFTLNKGILTELKNKNVLLSQYKNDIVADQKPIGQITKAFCSEVQDQKQSNEKYNIIQSLAKYLVYKSRLIFATIILLCILAPTTHALLIRLYAFYGDNEQTLFQNQRVYWTLLFLISFVQFCCEALFHSISQIYLIRTNGEIHNQMTKSICNARCADLDTLPEGSVINTFSNDLGVLDLSIVKSLNASGIGIVFFFLMFLAIIQIQIAYLLFLVLIVPTFYFIFSSTTPTIIKLKNQDLQRKNPIFNCLEELQSGATQIKLFITRQRYLQITQQIIKDSYQANKSYWSVVRLQIWLLEGFFCIFIIIAVFLGLRLIPDHKNYAITIVLLFDIYDYISITFISIITTKSQMKSASKCFSLIQIPKEMEPMNYNEHKNQKESSLFDQSLLQLKKSQWAIQFRNFNLKYQQNFPLALNRINLKIKVGQKIGIIGRTGAGKSSIINALMRMVEAQQGSQYKIFGENAQKLNLHTLRSMFSIIPQSPFTYPGSLRANIDPLQEFLDQEIWRSLEKVELTQKLKNLSNGLNTQLTKNQDIFSMGQKQLLQLARVILKKTEIVIMDEATSNIDQETDRRIQKIIKKQFFDKTMIIVAHRILTVADCDLIVVMEKGAIIEVGSPGNLMNLKGEFFCLVNSSDGAEKIKLMIKK